MKRLSPCLVFVTLVLNCYFASVQAHSVQEEPSHIRIAPRRDYLTIQITGAAVDWHDAASDNPHGSHTVRALQEKQESAAAANYARTHLIVEQAGRVLDLKVLKVNWRKLRASDDSSERCEIMLRAERPMGLASAPLNIASDLFPDLENSRTIIQLGSQTKTVRGAETAEFDAASSFPRLRDDLQFFAVAGVAQPLQSVVQLIFLSVLLLNLSLNTNNSLARILKITLGCQCLGVFLKLMGLGIPPILASLAFTLCIVVLGTLTWRTARYDATGPVNLSAALAGFCSGVLFVEPLQIWGLPERGLWLCGLGFVAAATLTQLGLAWGFWSVIQRCQDKFAKHALYGGMDWPRVVQIAAVMCTIAGGYYGLQAMG